MNKAYNPINWVNNETPINETNLNKMSNGLSAVDDRVIALNKTLGSYSDKINEALEASVVAQDAKEIALESAEKAEEALKNAEAVVGVGIATKDKAGLVKADDVHIASDGTLKFIEKTTSTTMPNSHKGRLLVEEIGGVCKQRTTTGTQLFDANALGLWTNKSLTVSSDEYTITAVGGTTAYANSFVTIDTNLVAGKTVYLKADSISNNAIVQLNIVNADGTNSYCPIYSGSLVRSISIPEDVTDVSLRIYTNNSSTALEADITATVKGLLLSFTDAEWEPYTGGIPSPNPEYPQEIKKSVVGEIKTHGKNFLDCRGLTERTLNGVTFTPVYDNNGNLLYIEVNGTATDGIGYYCGYHSMKNGIQYTLSGCSTGGTGGSTYQLQVANFGGDNGSGITNTYDSATMDTRVVIYIFSGYTATNLRFYPMIRKADIADDTYEPYTESSITLSQPIELYGIGDVQDVIDVENGVVRRNCKSVVYDGSDDEGWSTSNALSGRYIVVKNDAKNYGNILCTHAKNVNNSNNVNECCVNSAKYFYVNTSFATLAEWKAHLASKPMEVVYELAEEVIEELSIADQIALNSLLTYDGITYLEFDSEIEPTFKGEYGTSKVGGYTLEGLLTGRNAELLQQSNADRITALETALINNV